MCLETFLHSAYEQNSKVCISLPQKVCIFAGKARPIFDSFIDGDTVISDLSPWVLMSPSHFVKLKLFKILTPYSYS